jgi:hypothetical protein
MNGFLQRLAARATGQATQIHSATLSPYAAPAVPWGEAVPLHEKVAIPRASEPTTPLTPPTSPGRVAATGVVPAGSRPGAPNRDGLSDAVPAWQLGAIDADHVEPEPLGPPDSAPALPPEKRDEVRVPESVAALRAALGMQPRGSSEQAQAPAQVSQSEPRPVLAVAPEPLLPLAAMALTPSPTGMPSAAQPVLQYRLGGLIEETTEVHVSIGRIEVTAVHEAPQQRRPAPKANQPMSLDEYLARRQGRGT